ncbi:MAG: hypothetical protein ABL949_09705 [Fimbriimonadaceae bacterium]
MKKLLLFCLASIAILAVGCAPAEKTAETADPKATNTATAELAKCELCGTEVAKSSLASHDGKMACEACIKSHNH